MYHKYADDEVAKMMDISLRISQLESGYEEHIFTYFIQKFKFHTVPNHGSQI